MKVIDMTTKTEDIDSKKRKHDDVTNDVSKSSEKKKHKDKSHKKHKKEKSHKDKKEKDKKHKKHKHSHNEDKDNFNPLLQILGNTLLILMKVTTIIIYLATRLSNTTRHFSCEGWPL